MGGRGRSARAPAGARERTPAGSSSDAIAAGCCAPSSATRWSRSARRSRASRPDSRFPALLEWRRPGRRVVDQDRPARRPRCAPARSSGPVFVFDPFALVGSADATPGRRCARRADLGRRARGGMAARRGRRARPARRRGRGLLGDRRRAAAGAAAVRGRRDRRRRSTASSAGPTARARASCDEALAQLAGDARDERELADAHAAYDAVRAFEAQADRTRSSIEATAQALLRAYRFARVARSARVVRDHRRPPARRGGDAVPDRRRQGVEAAAADLPRAARRRSSTARTSARRARAAGSSCPLLLCLDEAGNVAPLPNLAEIASTAPSHNIQLVSIFHDLAAGAQPLRQAGRDGRQQPPRADAAARASPTSRRCATSPGSSARRRRAS